MNPTTEIPAYSIDMDAIRAYSAPPTNYMAFRYVVTGWCAQPGGALDRGEMVEGYFYGIEDGKEYLLSQGHVNDYLAKVTSEHVYYVTGEEPDLIYRTDLHGQEHSIIYALEKGTIVCIDYIGTDAYGDLYIGVYEGLGNYRVDVYNIAEGSTKTLFYAAALVDFSFMLTDYDPVIGPVLRWMGKLSGEEQYHVFHYYYIATDEHVDFYSFPAVEEPKEEPYFTFTIIYSEKTADEFPNIDWSNGVKGGLYGINKAMDTAIPLCDEPVVLQSCTSYNAYFVKESEQDAVYVIDPYTLQTGRYESEYGKITEVVYIESRSSSCSACYLAEDKYLVCINTQTGKSELYMELPYIDSGSVYDCFANDTLLDFSEIVFYGKLSEHCEYGEYILDRDSGVVSPSYRL